MSLSNTLYPLLSSETLCTYYSTLQVQKIGLVCEINVGELLLVLDCTLGNSVDSDQMPHDAASNQGLHFHVKGTS